MSFLDYAYQRPSMETLQKELEEAISSFEKAESAEAQSIQIERINEIRNAYASMMNICLIRHTMDTNNEFYEQENNFFDGAGPGYEKLNTAFYQALIKSPFRDALSKKWGNHLFTIAELALKTFEPKIMSLLQKENELKSNYVKEKANAKIAFRGAEYNISSISPFLENQDSKVREEAAHALWGYYDKASTFNEKCFDDLVKTRHQMAKSLGYDNFVQLGYARMLRSDYTPEMVAQFREQVLKEVVPLASSLYKRQQKRLGLEALNFSDEEFKFKTGNAKPKGKPGWIVKKASKMYQELSSETGTFFDFMVDQNLLDVETRDGKAPGGYCTFIDGHKAPFIFSNFNGTRGDVDVLTHEAGHAFQVYSSRDLEIMEYLWPTYEACEIHSMSMEFFTWPWMNLFFEEDVEKYYFSHLVGAIQFLPYGVAVDEFQHEVYLHPEMTPVERNACWRKIEQKYLPHRNFNGIEFLEKGGFWQKQSHIFSAPFYYIDYCLAQICAFQFWKKDQDNHEEAWSDYLRLCKKGGKHSFLKLVEIANLESPFNEGVIQSLVGKIHEWLEKIDDQNF